MSRIAQSTIEEIRARLPVSQVVSRYLQLKRAGREWRALSPFSKERTPSFFVSDQKGFYHCFSSGKHGNAIDFLMEMSGLTFPEAVEALAHEAGIPITREGITRETAESKVARASAIEVLECAQAFFVDQFRRSEEAIAFVRRRDLRRRIVGQLGIGWAPDGGRALLEHLADHGFSTADAVAVGLATDPEDPTAPKRDFFRRRITFPIRNRAGEVISFGGRAMEGGQPKYLNGRETPLFDKGRNLYNIDRARAEIARSGVAIVVEGYIDVASCVQAGIENIVAPLGTAMTVEHLHALWRAAPMILYMADGDEAGSRAADRTLETALPWISGDRRIAFAVMPAGTDPDTLVRSAGPNGIRSVLRSAQPTVDRLWQILRNETPGDGPEDRAKLETEIRSRLEVVGEPAMRRAFMDELGRRARRLGMARPQLGPSEIERRFRPAVPPREAALVIAIIEHPEYLEAELERFSALRLAAPIAQAVQERLITNASAGNAPIAGAEERDIAILRQALPQPLPSFVLRLDLQAFQAAMSLSAAQSSRRTLRASFHASS